MRVLRGYHFDDLLHRLRQCVLDMLLTRAGHVGRSISSAGTIRSGRV